VIANHYNFEKTSSADVCQDNPDTSQTVAFASNKSNLSTVIAQTVGGDVVVELTRVDDDNSEHHVSHLGIQDHVAGSSRLYGRSAQTDETTHLRVDTVSLPIDFLENIRNDLLCFE